MPGHAAGLLHSRGNRRTAAPRPVPRRHSLAKDGDVLRVALHAHMHFMEGAVVRWLSRSEITREQLRELILRALDGTIAAAEAITARRPGGLS